MTPPTHPGHKLDQVDSKIKNMGKSYMIRKKVINHPKILALRVAKYLKVNHPGGQVDSAIKDMGWFYMNSLSYPKILS